MGLGNFFDLGGHKRNHIFSDFRYLITIPLYVRFWFRVRVKSCFVVMMPLSRLNRRASPAIIPLADVTSGDAPGSDKM